MLVNPMFSDFYSPGMLSGFLADRLAREIETVHQAGRQITYAAHTGIMPMLDYLAGLAFDCIMPWENTLAMIDEWKRLKRAVT